MQDLQRAVAVIFRRRGGGAMAPTDFRHAASFDLKWFPPKESARMLEAAVRAELIVEEDGRLRPTFDVQRVDVPLGFRPGPEVLEPSAASSAAPAPPAGDHAATLGELLAEAAGVLPDDLAALARAERERAQDLVSEETAMLLAARRRGVDVRPYLS